MRIRQYLSKVGSKHEAFQRLHDPKRYDFNRKVGMDTTKVHKISLLDVVDKKEEFAAATFFNRKASANG